MSSSDSPAQRASMPGSDSPTVTPSKLSVPKRATRRRKASTGTPSPSPAPEDNTLSPAAQRQARRVSAGSAADPVPVGDDELVSANVKEETSEEPDLPTPKKPSRTKSTPTKPSGRQTTKTPVPPLPHMSLSSPEVFRRPRSSRKSPAARNKDAFGIESEIVELLRKPLDPTAINNIEKGNNYILSLLKSEHAQGKKLFKVGFTKGPISKRMYKIQYDCKVELEEKPYPNQRRIRHYKMAEALIKAELRSFWHRYDCASCSKEHQEYFVAPLDFGVEVTQRWTDFCAREPWDESGALHPFWMDRLNDWDMCGDEKEDYKRRAERWDKFVNPSWWDIAMFNMPHLAQMVWPRRWQFVCSAQALYVAYVTYPNAEAIMIALLVQFTLFLEAGLGNDFLIMELTGGTPVSKKASSPRAGSESPEQSRQGSKEPEEMDAKDLSDDALHEDGPASADVLVTAYN